jgi:hypothetical protein
VLAKLTFSWLREGLQSLSKPKPKGFGKSLETLLKVLLKATGFVKT